MKSILITLILFVQLSYSQSDYFNGKYTFCTMPDDKEVKENFKLGIDCINSNLYLGGANRLFLDIIKKDSTFCDAYFFAAYTYNLYKMDEAALTYYYLADSLSNNKSIIFKQNLASTAVKMGRLKLARKKYEEIKQYFPESPEGFYGVAATSIFLGDSEIGLENIREAFVKYRKSGIVPGEEVFLTQGIILTRNKRFLESVNAFEKLNGSITKNDDYRSHYAYSLMRLGKETSDEKMIKLAKKIFEKIENKENLSEVMLAEFN